MLGKKKLFALFIIISLFSIFFIMNGNVKANNGSSSHNFTGNYGGDASILYFWENPPGNPFLTWNDNRSSIELLPNVSNTQNYVFSANSMELQVYGIQNGSGTFTQVIAENTSSWVNVTNAVQVAQEFNVSTLSSVQRVWFFLNHSLKSNYRGMAYITDENLSTILARSWEMFFSSSINYFQDFWMSGNVLEPSKKYFMVFEMYLDNSGMGAIEVGGRNSSWKAEEYNNSIYNKGRTLTYNGSAWDPIPNDNSTDMLCRFEYRKVIHPSAANLTIYLNNQTREYQTRIGMWGGDGYAPYFIMKFPVPPNQPINLTITTNITIPTVGFNLRLIYVYLVPVTGYYNATSSNIDWTMIYSHRYVKDAWAMPEQMFAFEQDWDYIDFCDPYDIPVSEIYFGPLDFFNKSYLGLFKLAFMGFPLELGTHTGHFTSPNYCHTINGKVRGESGFLTMSSFELGQNVTLEALVEDTNNNLISGGNATINFTSPSGQLIYSETNISSINGLLSTSEFNLLLDLETGLYTISIFWTNGVEVGCYSVTIEVKPQTSMLMWYILIGVGFGLAIAAVPLATYTRRKIQTRNWEKHLRNLFILSKDGRSIYGYSFGIEIQDPALISSALMAITTFVGDAVKSKKALRVIDLQDKKVILSHGTHTIVALIAEKAFPVIHNRTEQFMQAFEARYGKKVAVWRGETKVFKGTDELIQEYFPVSMEERITRGVKLKLIETRELLASATEPQVIISILRNVTQLLTRYRPIIEQYYMDDYAELIQAAEEKMKDL